MTIELTIVNLIGESIPYVIVGGGIGYGIYYVFKKQKPEVKVK